MWQIKQFYSTRDFWPGETSKKPPTNYLNQQEAFSLGSLTSTHISAHFQYAAFCITNETSFKWHTLLCWKSHMEPVGAGLPLSAFWTRCNLLFQSVALDLRDLNDGITVCSGNSLKCKRPREALWRLISVRTQSGPILLRFLCKPRKTQLTNEPGVKPLAFLLRNHQRCSGGPQILVWNTDLLM